MKLPPIKRPVLARFRESINGLRYGVVYRETFGGPEDWGWYWPNANGYAELPKTDVVGWRSLKTAYKKS